MPQPATTAIESQWIGLRSLAEHPDRKIILTDNPDDYAATIVLFDDVMVVMSFEGDAALLERSPFVGRTVIVWPRTRTDDATAIARRIAHVATAVDVVTGAERSPIDFVGETGPQAVAYARPLLQRVTLTADEITADLYEPPTPSERSARAAMLTDYRDGTPEPELIPATPKRRARAKDEAKARQQDVIDAATSDTELSDTDSPGYTSWERLGLVVNASGVPLPNIDNAARVLERHPALAGRLWYDTFLGRTLTTWDTDEPREWCDGDDVALTVWMQRRLNMGKMSLASVRESVNAVIRANQRNEVAEYLASVTWDRTERLATLMTRGFGAPQSEYHAAVGRNWITAMVARAMDPGCQVHAMPVFEGSQGRGKSQAVAIIGGKWATVCNTNILSPEFFKVIEGRLVVEIAEMHAFSRSEVNAIKGIISTATDRYRDSYGRRATNHPRTCVFAGTTNRDDWNNDDTGARRFWPVACGYIDLDWIEANRDQLFAEAVDRYQSETCDERRRTAASNWWSIPADEAAAEQDARRLENPWLEAVEQALLGQWQARITDLLTDVIKIDIGRITRSDMLAMGTTLRQLGWEKRNKRVGGVQGKTWVKIGTEGNDELL